MKKLILFVVLFGCCLGVICGCQNSRDIEDYNFIMTLAIEKGEEKLFKFIYEIADFSDKEKDSSMLILTYEADSFEEAEKMNLLQSNKKLDYGHLKILLLSQDIMKEKEIRQNLIGQLEKKNSIAGTTFVVFTGEEIEELIKNCGEKNGISFGEYVEMMKINQKEEKKTLTGFLKDYSEGKQEIGITILKEEEKHLKMLNGIMKWDEEARFLVYYDSVLRFHVKANSDEAEDQYIKGAIKDEILGKLQRLLKESDTKEECVRTIEESHNIISVWVKEACAKYHSSYEGRVYFVKEEFPLKVYGDYVVPNGFYDALRIDLGKGQGANWWCMLYPELCLSDGVVEGVSEKGKEQLKGEETEEFVTGKEKKQIHIRWKIKELWQEFWETRRGALTVSGKLY